MRDLPATMSATDALVDYKFNKPSGDDEKRKSKDKGKDGYQDVQSFDAGYQEHVGGGQIVQFHVWLVALGTNGVKKTSSA